MARYTVYHTVDESGGRCMADEGWIARETDDLAAAIADADRLTAAGQCGYVRREDGSTLMPDDSWAVVRGQPG